MARFESWGRYPRGEQEVRDVAWRGRFPEMKGTEQSLLFVGQGRSYGDVCLNHGARVYCTRWLNRLIDFDEASGILTCEAGTTLGQILEFAVPKGWFLPVSPGTKYVSVGGAIANDIHGKNHHRGGTFGCHVESFILRRSDGRQLHCSPDDNQNYYAATIGGMGLTGLIESARIRLRPIVNAYIDTEEITFRGLKEFFALNAESDKDFEYTVAWIDCVSSGKNFARGIFMRGNHSEDTTLDKKTSAKPKLAVPVDFPSWVLNKCSIKLFNACYYHKQRSKHVKKVSHYEPFFYPLDSVLDWNKIYGKRGFLQFQCVVPFSDNGSAIESILSEIVAAGRASFLAVIKVFGSLSSPGMLSFPRPGVTLTLDFACDGAPAVAFLDRLDAMVRAAGGALYPAKDATMSSDSFQEYYPRWKEFCTYIDPVCSSSFWRRVTGEEKK